MPHKHYIYIYCKASEHWKHLHTIKSTIIRSCLDGGQSLLQWTQFMQTTHTLVGGLKVLNPTWVSEIIIWIILLWLLSKKEGFTRSWIFKWKSMTRWRVPLKFCNFLLFGESGTNLDETLYDCNEIIKCCIYLIDDWLHKQSGSGLILWHIKAKKSTGEYLQDHLFLNIRSLLVLWWLCPILRVYHLASDHNI